MVDCCGGLLEAATLPSHPMERCWSPADRTQFDSGESTQLLPVHRTEANRQIGYTGSSITWLLAGGGA
jgi:hypothetical protein